MSTPYQPYPTPPPSGPTGPVGLSQPLRGASIGAAYGRFWKKYATFEGRASRSEFWWAALVNVVIGIVLSTLGRSVGLFEIIYLLFGLATIVPSLALGARRLHDIGRTGWWQLLELTIIGGIVLIVFWALPPTPEGAKYDVA